MTGCTGLLDTLVSHKGYTFLQDHAYGEGPRQRLDIYVPTAKSSESAPIIVFFYGGYWRTGDKANYRFVGQALAARGIVVVIADYRLYPEVRFPDFLSDNAAAVAWVHQHARDFGGDLKRVYLMGHSAGAYNAVMLTVDPRWLAAVGLDSRRDIKGTIALAGPYDFLPFDTGTEPIFATVSDENSTQPVHLANGQAPPMLLATGDSDMTVAPRNSKRLSTAIVDRGGHAELRIYPHAGHIAIITALSEPFQWLASVLDDTVAFIKAHP